MKATEAHQKTTEIVDKNKKDEYHLCQQAIEISVQRGYYECVVYDNISVEVAKKLIEDGYLIERSSFRDEYNFTIKWGHIKRENQQQ